MTTTLPFGGDSFNLPDNREPKGWGAQTAAFLRAVAQKAITNTGGNSTLTAELNFGATYGTVAVYYKSRTSNISTTGIVRLANNEGIGWRNAANGADLIFKVNASNALEYNGATLSMAAELTAHISDTTDAHAGTAITNTPSGNLAATTVQDALNELQSDIDTRATSSSLSSHESDTSTHGVSTVAGLDETQTFTNKTHTSPIIATDARYANQAIAKFYEQTGNGTNFVGLSAPDAVTADATFKLPNGDGSAGQLLGTDGSKNLGWVSPLTNPMTAVSDVIVGGTAGAATRLPTSLLGDIGASISTATITVTIATPGVVSHTSHGRITGEKVFFTTTGALPTGITASTTYYVIYIDANSYNLATTYANAIAGTKVATSGTQSGVHTGYVGGLVLTPGTQRGLISGSAVTSGYVGERIESAALSNVTLGLTDTDYTCGTLTLNKGVYMVFARTRVAPAGTTQIYTTIGISRSGAQAHPNYVVDLSTGIVSSRYQQVWKYELITADATPVYLICTAGFTGTTPSFQAAQSEYFAIRVA